MLQTIINSKCNIIIRMPKKLKQTIFCQILHSLEKVDKNIICVFSTLEECKQMFTFLKTNKRKVLYTKNQKFKLSERGNFLICTPERFDATLAFYPFHNWLSEFDSVIFYDSDLLLNSERSNILEADIIRVSRFNPFVRKILIFCDVENVESLAVWTKSCLIDYVGKGKEEYKSKFLEEENVLTQSLIEIVSSGSRTLNELRSFFERSFSYFQGNSIPSLRHILSKLIDHNLILKRENYYPTSLGKLCVGLRLPIVLQIKIISELRRGVSPQTLKKTIVRHCKYSYKWICDAIDSISRLIGCKV